ncbi:DUF3558 domain-containing protein [Saccharopolyspora sp. WRP15-2]|uniref:DUF3558 domain-containing protein n=2 Tax=Saccharopolyspora TaxID=1835 RepID=A0ABT4UTL1_9PSEU|nr:DUF3558 domain-containing protein [Saccharopolyspora oryzae]MDA3625057.1 DUF3558 domain-containing protein [Saccharopolyspora oryzae]
MRTTRVAAVAAAGIATLLLSACSGGQTGGNPETTSAASSGLAGFDPCTALSSSELQNLGVSGESKPYNKQGEVGCDYEGDDLLLTVLKAEGRDLAAWEGRRNNFDSLTKNDVGGRQGLQGIALGGTGQGVCNQFVDAGKDSLDIVVVLESDRVKDTDPCAKALEVAQVVEQKLPK